MQSLVLEIPKNIEKFKEKIARQEDKGKLEEPRNEGQSLCLSGTEPSKNKFLEKRPRDSGSSLFSISNGSFRIKHNSSFHDSFPTKGD